MPTYNGIEVTEDFSTFFAPHFIPLISPIRDPREQDNVNLTYPVSSYLSAIILGICQGATTMRQIALFSRDQAFQQQISEDGHDKGSEKKAATRLLKRMAESHLLDLIDVVLCDALYADAAFIRTATSYDLMPIIRIKQENDNIMKEVTALGEPLSFSKSDDDDERKRRYQYRVFEHLTSWQAYPDELCIVEIHEQLPDGMIQKSRWVFPQIHASTLLPPIVREIDHLRWQEEINEFKLANQHFDIKHILHHEQNSIQIFLFLKLFVSAFISLFLSQKEPSLQKKVFCQRYHPNHETLVCLWTLCPLSVLVELL